MQNYRYSLEIEPFPSLWTTKHTQLICPGILNHAVAIPIGVNITRGNTSNVGAKKSDQKTVSTYAEIWKRFIPRRDMKTLLGC